MNELQESIINSLKSQARPISPKRLVRWLKGYKSEDVLKEIWVLAADGDVNFDKKWKVFLVKKHE
jgi:hypothetical protein